MRPQAWAAGLTAAGENRCMSILSSLRQTPSCWPCVLHLVPSCMSDRNSCSLVARAGMGTKARELVLPAPARPGLAEDPAGSSPDGELACFHINITAIRL